MQHKKTNTKKIVLLAMFSAIAYIIVSLVRIPVILFLSYEPKDVIITIGGFLFGPLASAIISLIVSLTEMFTISDTGPIGALMNFLSTCRFSCTAALVYKKIRTGKGALLGLLAGSVSMIVIMLLWNWLITPLYMGAPREAVEAMLVPVFLPFNALKAGLNTAITLFLYKPLVTGLRKARLVEASPAPKSGSKLPLYVVAGLLLIACTLVLLILQDVI